MALNPWHIPLDLEDLLIPDWKAFRKMLPAPRAIGKVHHTKNNFQVCLDVQQFTPDEISVKTVGDLVVVEGKHEEKQDEHGYISRHFVRKYHLPKGHRPEDVVSSFSEDGILTIQAPREPPHPAVEGERHVPITITGPHRTAAIGNVTKA